MKNPDKFKPIDLRAFKGLYNDLDEIGFALSAPEAGQEAVGLARKALGRMQEFLEGNVADPSLGVLSDLKFIGAGLGEGRSGGLFSGGPKLDSAREAHQHLRRYIEGLEKAWIFCQLAPGQADEAGRRKLAG